MNEYVEKVNELARRALNKDPKNRSYLDRYLIWQFERCKDNNFDNEGEEVFIYDGTKLANNEIKDGFGKDFPEWFRECGKYFGRYVKTFNDNIYTLIGLSYTYLDYYYLLEDNKGNIITVSCIEKITYM